MMLPGQVPYSSGPRPLSVDIPNSRAGWGLGLSLGGGEEGVWAARFQMNATISLRADIRGRTNGLYFYSLIIVMQKIDFIIRILNYNLEKFSMDLWSRMG